MLQNHPPLVARNSSGFYPFTVDNSLRFNSADSAYLQRSAVTASSTTQQAFSCWTKLGKADYQRTLLLNRTDTPNYTHLILQTDGTLYFLNYDASVLSRKVTTPVLRDHSSWYNFVVIVDTTLGTASERIKIYVNGVRITTFGTSADPVLNETFRIVPTATLNNIGRYYNGTTYSAYADQYMACTAVVDGAASITDFGEFKNGVWVPKDLSGLTFGSGGYLLDFKDATSATTLGYDVSGNANHWTPSGIATNDQMTDTPTNNYCTGNPLSLHNRTSGASDGYFENGSLDWVVGGGVRDNIMCSQLLPQSGKCYFEVRYQDGANLMDGSLQVRNADHPWSDTTSHCGVYLASGANDLTYGIVNGTSNSTSHAGTWHDTRLVCGLAVDIDTGEFWIHQAGSWLDSNGAVDATANPSTGVNPTGTITASNRSNLVPMVSGYSDSGTHANVLNFGQNGTFSGAETAGGNSDANGQGDFFYAVPTDFLALCTANLPEPTLSPNSAENVTDYFDVVLYEGTGAELAITDLSFSPSMVVIKNRDAADQWMIFDTVRGATKYLSWDGTDIEVTDAQSLKSFDANGFTLGTNVAVNTSAESYVAYCFKEHADFFDMFTYTGTGSAHTEAHSLNVAPNYIEIKSTTFVGSIWLNYFESLPVSDPETDYLTKDTDAAAFDTAIAWNDTAPTASVITVGTAASVNDSGDTFLAQLFANLEGMCKVGYYEGNGSADGPFAYCGFRPACIIIKMTTTSSSWLIYDVKRDTFNGQTTYLQPHLPDVEGAGGLIDILSNGFKIRTTAAGLNTSTYDHVFLAFSEMPFKYSNAR